MIIVGPERRETAEKLARTLGCLCYGTDDVDASLSRFLQHNHEFVVNYGGRYERANLNTTIILNKLRAMEMMRAARVKVPDFYASGTTIPESAFPVLARNRFHSNGRDIRKAETAGQLSRMRYDFVTKYIDKDAEYRVHAWKYPGDRWQARLFRKTNENESADNTICSDDTWLHVDYDEERYPVYTRKLKELGIAATKALGYDFGASDIIRKDTDFYVLEVNSGPWLNNEMTARYASFFTEREAAFRASSSR